METIIQPVIPNIEAVADNRLLILNWLIIMSLTALSAFIMARYSAERYKTNRKKTVTVFVLVSMITALAMLCFFGSGVIAVKGIVLSLIFIMASFEDFKTHECDDFIHFMIIIAAFIGTDLNSMPDKILSAMFIFIMMIATVVLVNGKIGGADVKFSVACGFLLGSTRTLVGLMLGLVVAITVNSIINTNKKNKAFPMIPYLAIGFMTVFFI